jgi:hypothetical protein
VYQLLFQVFIELSGQSKQHSDDSIIPSNGIFSIFPFTVIAFVQLPQLLMFFFLQQKILIHYNLFIVNPVGVPPSS